MGGLQSRVTSVFEKRRSSGETDGMGCFGSRMQTCKTHLRRTYNGKRPLREQSKRMLTQLARVTHFTVAEVKQWYRLFLTDCPDGQLSERQFVGFYCNHFEHGNAEIKAILARRIFHTFDRDASGCVDFREFLCGMSAMLRGTPMERLKWAFCIFDLNSDGTVSKKELINVLTEETNIDDLLLAQERREREHHIQEVTEKIFEELDSDQDGFLILREFIEGLRRDPGLLQIVRDSTDSCHDNRLPLGPMGDEQTDSTHALCEEAGTSCCHGDQATNGHMYGLSSDLDREDDESMNSNAEK
ncbi:PREDICTED: neurocalcin homolog [Branchiostoma belcheri]|uniref:Neurocalcin homolog n=1 Tax=Branchiostoma belcheri TaxID=7741 RepID=A0A6P4YYD7_BRABE|nr:PREDICTED: neurocalcin homolog [Branchiostoma belcheri]